MATFKILIELTPFDNVKYVDMQTNRLNCLISIFVGFFLLWRIFVRNLKFVRHKLFELSCHIDKCLQTNLERKKTGHTDKRTDGQCDYERAFHIFMRGPYIYQVLSIWLDFSVRLKLFKSWRLRLECN